MSNVVNGSLTMIPVPQTSGLFVSGVFSDSTVFSVSVPQGSRVPLVTGSIYYGSAIFHADGLSVCIENAYAGLLNDLTGNFTVSYGTTVLFSGDLTIWAYSRTRPFWVSAPPLISSPDLTKFMVYGSGSESVSFYATYSALPNTPVYSGRDNSPMGIGFTRNTFGAAGESTPAQFGPLPDWDAAWMANKSANNLIVVRGMADSVGVWPHVVIDPTTNSMIHWNDYPKLTMYSGQRGVVGNPIVAFSSNINDGVTKFIQFDQVQNHATNYCALSNALWGTDYDKEAIKLWANYVGCIVQNWPYRLSSGYATGGYSRGKGRTLRTALYAAEYSDESAYFKSWIDSFSTYLSGLYAAQTGVHIDQEAAAAEGYTNYGYAPWQEHILINSLGTAIKLGYTGFQAPFDYLCVSMYQALLDSPHEYASIYECVWRGGDGSAGNTIAADWAGVLTYTGPTQADLLASFSYAENSLQLIQTLNAHAYQSLYVAGDFTQLPWDPDYQPSKLKIAIVAAASVATDQTRAQAALTAFNAHMRTGIYAGTARYNIIPW